MKDNSPINGHQLEQALQQDKAQREQAARTFNSEEIKLSLRAPCPVCNAHEHGQCCGAHMIMVDGATLPEWSHIDRLKLAMSFASRQAEIKTAELGRSLSRGDALMNDPKQWRSAMEYVNRSMQHRLQLALEELGRELGVLPTWLAMLPNKIAVADANKQVRRSKFFDALDRAAGTELDQLGVMCECPRIQTFSGGGVVHLEPDVEYRERIRIAASRPLEAQAQAPTPMPVADEVSAPPPPPAGLDDRVAKLEQRVIELEKDKLQ